MKAEPLIEHDEKFVRNKYPITDLVAPKPIRSYDGKGPYGDFGSEEMLIGYLETLDDKTLKKVSDLYTVMVRDKGGWLFTDRLYEDKPRTELDTAIYNTRSCRSVHDRKTVVREQILTLLREYAETGRFLNQDFMKIYDLGSGPSDYTVEAFAKYIAENDIRGLDFPARGTCIDLNPSALRRGKKLAKEAGVKRYIDYRRGRMGTILKERKINDVDLIMAIGVICPLSDEVTMKLFNRVRDSLNSGGKFYTCAMRHHPLENVLNKAGWKLNHREPEKIEKMMKEASYGNLEIYLGPEELFVMALGQKLE
jgi:SAM-dependent methyltransferase